MLLGLPVLILATISEHAKTDLFLIINTALLDHEFLVAFVTMDFTEKMVRVSLKPIVDVLLVPTTISMFKKDLSTTVVLNDANVLEMIITYVLTNASIKGFIFYKTCHIYLCQCS